MFSPKRTIRIGAFFVLLLALIALSFQVPGQPRSVLADALSGHWVEGFGRGVLHGGIWEMAVDGAGNLYGGGSFDEFGAMTAHNIVRWDGSAWHPVGGGTDGGIKALAIDAQGRVYAGGDFTHAGGLPANHVAVWDGVRWQALGSGLNGRVRDLEIDASGNLYAVGEFTRAGALTVNRIAKWDGEHWSALGGGLPGRVNAVTVAADGTVYAAYAPTLVINDNYGDVRKWDGQTWTVLPKSWVNGSIFRLAIDKEGHLYAGGVFTRMGGVTMDHIARWDGAQWSSPGGGVDGDVYEMAADARGRVVATGEFENAGGAAARYVARWDGAAWQAVGSGFTTWIGEHVGVYALAMYGNSGMYVGRAGAPYRLEEGVWRYMPPPQGSGVDKPVRALADDGRGGFYAGGEFDWVGSVRARRVAHFDGGQWQALGDGLNNTVYAVVVAPDGTLYAGGKFTATASSGVSLSHIARWDGHRWSGVGGGMDSAVWTLFMGDDGNLYAGGGFERAGGVAVNHVARWDGQHWSALGDGLDGSVASLLMASDGTLYAGGWFDYRVTVAGHQERLASVAYWDGHQWRGLDDGLTSDHYVTALAMDGEGNLYAGGYFTRIAHGNVAAYHVARWDGSRWQPMGSGMSITDGYGAYVTVNALVADSQGRLFAGGLFNRAGGHAANYVACWDGRAWQPLAEGLSGPSPYRTQHVRARALTMLGNSRLLVGGYFDHAGGLPSVNVALWSWQVPLYMPMVLSGGG